MGQVRIADIPSTENIDAESYVIIERPGKGYGTYKSTVSDLQKVITVTANIKQVDDVVTISISDINGSTSDQFVIPSATMEDNGDNTVTFTVKDTEGTSSITLLRDSRLVDPTPTEGSQNIVTSDTIFNIQQSIQSAFTAVSERLDDISNKIEDIQSRLDEIESTYLSS